MNLTFFEKFKIFSNTLNRLLFRKKDTEKILRTTHGIFPDQKILVLGKICFIENTNIFTINNPKLILGSGISELEEILEMSKL